MHSCRPDRCSRPEDDEVEYAWAWTMQATENGHIDAVPVFTPEIMAGVTERGRLWTVTVLVR